MARSTPNRITPEDAEGIALQILGFLADDAPRMSRFLSLTGIGPEQVRAEAGTREFQAAVLEYILGDESLLLAFCQERGVDPMRIAPAHFLLAGGA